MESIKEIEKKLTPKDSGVHHFVSHEQVSQTYTRFREKHPNNILRLGNDAVDYVYELRFLTPEEQQAFVNHCLETYSPYGSYNGTSKMFNIKLPLSSTLIVPQCFSKRGYGFHVLDGEGQYIGSLGLVEVQDVEKPFKLDLFLNKNVQSKGIGTRAMQVLSDFVDDERLGCKNVHLVVGSSNRKAALVYARSGYKPTNQFLETITTALKCNTHEAYAKILDDSRLEKLQPLHSLMVRERGAANQIISSAWSEQELLAYVRSIDSPLPRVKLPSIGTMFKQQTAANANTNRIPAGKADMDVVIRGCIQRENNRIQDDTLKMNIPANESLLGEKWIEYLQFAIDKRNPVFIKQLIFALTNTQINPQYQHLSTAAKSFFGEIAYYMDNAHVEFLFAYRENNQEACQHAVDEIVRAASIIVNFPDPTLRFVNAPNDLVKELARLGDIPDGQNIFLNTMPPSLHLHL
jgi:GNAT superfamily N-acetyltransferase